MGSTVVNGARLHYDERGEGAAILCIHGLGSTSATWSGALDKLAEHGRAIGYDRRGCHRSERPEGYERTTVAEQATDAAALLDELGAAPALVIARSYGGAVAIRLTLGHPDRVRALALLEGDALGLSEQGLRWTRAIRDRVRDVAERDGVDAVYATIVEEFVATGAWESFSEEVREILTGNGPAALAELSYVDEEHPSAADFAAIEVPVLLVSASDSPPEQRAMNDAMERALPNARTAEVSGGHLIDPARPEVIGFVREILESR